MVSLGVFGCGERKNVPRLAEGLAPSGFSALWGVRGRGEAEGHCLRWKARWKPGHRVSPTGEATHWDSQRQRQRQRLQRSGLLVPRRDLGV